MSTIRVQKNNNYTTINNTGLNDANLTWKAKGILAYLLSKPDDWKCQVNDLIKKSKDGRDSIYSGLRELRENGYMVKRPIKNEKNIIIEWEEILYETPQVEAKEIYKKQKIKNEAAALKKAENIKKKKQTPLTGNPEVVKSTYGKSTSGKSVYGKPVDILSTDLLSTDVTSTDLVVEVVTKFEDNICELKRTTKIKYLNYFKKCTKEFIFAVIDLCAESNIKSFAGFKVVIDSYIQKEILTPELLEEYVSEYRKKSAKLREKERINRENRANNKIKNSKNSTFNDYTQREYDYDSLEKKLLGWE